MNITLTATLINAPLSGVPNPTRQKSHQRSYRRTYVLEMVKRQAQHALHGTMGCKGKGKIIQHVGLMTQIEVARSLNITREAVRQTENRALAKLRRALLPFYLDLQH